jgi:hypothetical protein
VAHFTLGAKELGKEENSSFSEFINIAMGRSITSGADWGKERIELGLSGDGMIRIFWTPEGLETNFISTTNKDEIPPLILKIIDGDKRLPARVLENRLRALRTLYAIVHLSITNRFHLIQEALNKDPQYDLELLLNDDELLYIECLAPGSWYVTLWSKTKKSYKSILQMASMISERGSEATLKKLEAEARLKELKVEEKEFELFTKKIDYSMNLRDKLNTDNEKNILDNRIKIELSNFLLTNNNSEDFQKAKKQFMGNK